MKKGFTLIELLAVIIILGTISLIITPAIIKILEDSDKDAFYDSATGLLEAAELYNVEHAGEVTILDLSIKEQLRTLKFKGEPPIGGKLKIYPGGGMSLYMYDKKWCAKKSVGEKRVKVEAYDENCKEDYEEEILNGAIPEIQDGMIPITYENNKPIKADRSKEWYSYEKKEWANAVVVKKEKVEEYQNQKAGEEINSSDILGYFVWIPRYRYKLFNVEGTASTTPTTIEIIFENSGIKKSNGSKNGEYLTAPGFTFGNDELNGYWVGKFETTGTASNPTVLPNVSSLRSQNVSTQFTTSKKFEKYVSGDAHMSKNSEWGAISYLSHSKYGINKEIRINNNSNYKTGCGASSDNAASSSSCDTVFGSASSYPQSTTGNIYGVFDMSGGAWEHQMSVLADDKGKPRSGYTATSYTAEQAKDILGRTDGISVGVWNSGFNGLVYGKHPTTGETLYVTNGKNFPDKKYYDLYETTDWKTACKGEKCLGGALQETGKWYNDYNGFVSVSNPWMDRGGHNADTTNAGAFISSRFQGSGYSQRSFRLIIAPV